MPRRGRVGSVPDTQRLSHAVSRPGIDPRIWCSLAFARSESMIDPKHGEFVDVTLLPSELEITARVPAAYAGKVFGDHDGTIHKDDELVILLPMGHPMEGAVVVARLFNAVDTPSQEAIANPKDLVRVAEDASNVRSVTKKGGKEYITTDGGLIVETKKIRLGSENSDENLILGKTYRQNEGQSNSQLSAQLKALGAALTSAAAFMSVPTIGGAAAPLTQAGTAANQAAAAIDTFEGSAGDYLSQVSKTEK